MTRKQIIAGCSIAVRLAILLAPLVIGQPILSIRDFSKYRLTNVNSVHNITEPSTRSITK